MFVFWCCGILELVGGEPFGKVVPAELWYDAGEDSGGVRVIVDPNPEPPAP